MIVSRCLALNGLRSATKKNLLLQNNVDYVRKTITRNHKMYYRKLPDLDEFKDSKGFLFIASFTWWYVLWHCFTNYHLLLGHSYPDPSKWTDEELGIPED